MDLPKWAPEPAYEPVQSKKRFRSRFLRRFLFTVSFFVLTYRLFSADERARRVDERERGMEQCDYIYQRPGPSREFFQRITSDRYEKGTPGVWIRNATIWTGTETLIGELVLDSGLIKYVGPPRDRAFVETLVDVLEEVDAEGRWVTPGIVDAHSHAGLLGGNSVSNDIHPYLRVLDELDFTVPDFELITAGGVTTSLLLPGSAVGIGGQAFVAKFRPTSVNTASAKLVEPPFEWYPGRNMTGRRIPSHWRHMKHALGENPNGVFGIVRMDNIWEMRKAYSAAKEWQTKQRNWCEGAKGSVKDWILGEASTWPWEGERGPFPTAPIEHEALVDVLNGKVKLNVHSYEVADFDALVRISNEFGIEVAGIHHAHEAWLAPELIKGMYKHPPAVCIFSSFSMYKQESERWSPFAPRILHDAGLDVVMKSDHSGVVARYLPREAAIAHHWGLDEDAAMRSITTNPARAIGLDHRVGYLRKGYDADVVIWQGHPLAGASPLQVYVDGIPQVRSPAVRPSASEVPPSGDFDRETAYEIETKGTPDLSPRAVHESVLFRNVKNVWLRRNGTLANLNPSGKLVDVHFGSGSLLLGSDAADHSIDLKGGSIQPGLVAFGANLGLSDIDNGPPNWLERGGAAVVPHGLQDFALRDAADVVEFGEKKLYRALQSGFTYSITAPNYDATGVIRGVSCLMRIGASHSLEGVVEDQIALHVRVDRNAESGHLQLGTLRSLLGGLDSAKGTPLGNAMQEVAKGKLPLIVEVVSADAMARLITIKEEFTNVRMIFHGATEAWMLANEIKAAGISVIVAPVRSFPYSQAEARALPGVPLGHETVISALWKAGVNLGVGIRGDVPPFTSGVFSFRWDLENARKDTTIDIPLEEWYKMATTNIEAMLLDKDAREYLEGDFVAVQGASLMEFGGKVVGFSSGQGVAVF